MKSGLQVLSALVVLAIIGAVVVWSWAWQGRLVGERQIYNALDTQGFTNCTIVKRDVYFVSWLGGSRGDHARFTVIADNPRGKRVTVYVYAGWPFKAATIRAK